MGRPAERHRRESLHLRLVDGHAPSPRRATTWPRPRSPSSTAMTGRSTTVVIRGVGLISPILSPFTYCGIRMTPWESWPRRLARTSCRATHAASSLGTPHAAKMSRVTRSSVSASIVGIASAPGRSGARGALLDYPAACAKASPKRSGSAISACLLGQEVRYDGGHKRDAFLTDTLGPFVEWVPVCPEVEIGLGVPRDTLRLVGDRRRAATHRPEDAARISPRACSATRGRERRNWPRSRLHGYVLKRASPSCGLFRVRVYRRERHAARRRPRAVRRRAGRALPAAARRGGRAPERSRHPRELHRARLRRRALAGASWTTSPRARDLVAFHAAHKFAILAHSPRHYAALGRHVAARRPRPDAGEARRVRQRSSWRR